jgi:hypothetical protein
MNERIKELIKAAGLNIDGYGYPIWGCLDGEDEKKAFLEKFAELIVKECAAMTRNLSPHGELAEKAVKEYFGVK